MKKLRWQVLVVVVTLAVVGVLLITQQPGQQTFIPQPASGGVYTEALIGSLSRLNPTLDQNNSADRDIDRLIFSGLIKFDARGLPQPDLAASWGVSQDGTIYNFSIRPDAVWQDGQPVTSDDILFTISLIQSDSSFFPQDVRDMWKQIKVTKLNDKTLQFKLPEPFAPFLDYLTFGVLPQHILGNTPPDQIASAPFNLSPVGTGPYKFDHVIVENGQVAGVALRASDTYYGKKPFIDQVIFRYFSSSAAALDAYSQGQVLGISEITPDVLPEALKEPNLSIYTGRLPELSLLLFNLKNDQVPFLQDSNLRRALLMALNRERIIGNVLDGQAIVADGPIFPGTWAYYNDIEHVGFDPEGAVSLLKNNDYKIPATGGNVRQDKDGKALEFTMIYPDDQTHAQIAQMIQSDWAAVGVKVDLKPVAYDSLINDYLAPHQYEAALADLNLARTPDPDPYPFWHQSEATGGQNYTQWDNRSASEYLEQARVNPDFTVRTRLYRNFQVIFAQDLPALPLYYPVYSYGVDQQVLGVQMPPLFDTSDRFLTISNWYLVTRRELQETAVPTP